MSPHFIYCILHLCLVVLYIFYLLLEMFNFSCIFCMFAYFHLLSSSVILSLPWTLSQVDCLSPFHLVLSCSFVWNMFLFCLILTKLVLYFSIFDMLVTFPELGEMVLSRSHLMCFCRGLLSLFTRAIYSRGSSVKGCIGLFVVASWLFRPSGRLVWLPVWLVARLCLVWTLLATVWQGLVMRRLTAEARGALGLVLVRWVESGSRRL